MNNDTAHKRRWETGEFFIGLPYLAGIGLHILFPAPIVQESSSIILKIAGMIIMVSGLVLLGQTRRQFNTHQQPTDPGQTGGRPWRTIATSRPSCDRLSADTLAARMRAGSTR